ncbi:MAG: nucleotidyl transferase AbiEii/AbiGii toxin family protein, partial [Ignavibacteria bacterium]|nr:nucleotidyl transferase AbiEii/AbiGii toxin family protein [Ignavibacteria bacterium]
SFLKDCLIFKGGTALRKIYFPDFRLSEDLDFTFKGDDFNKDEIKKRFEELIEWIGEEARITMNIQDEAMHQTGNYNFYLGYSGPLGGIRTNKSLKVDIANDEILCKDPIEKPVNNEYTDLNDEFKVLSYTLDEIISEKMRSLMQRTMPRDLYDIWYLLEIENYEIEECLFDYKKKVEFKKLNPNELTNIVQNKKDRFKRLWEDNLVNQIKDVPEFKDVWRRLSNHWKKFEKLVNN